MDKIGLLIGIILGAIGLYRLDIVLIAGLNYFGKYVFFVLFHLFIVYIYYLSYKKFSGFMKTVMPIFIGIIILLLGVKLGV